LDIGPETVLEVDGQQPVVGLGSRNHRVSLGHLDGNRLLHQHVAARVERVDGQGGVKRMGGDDDRHIRLCLGQHLAVIQIEGGVQFVGPFLARIGNHIRDADDLHVIQG
jgi:hypothetical protein